MRTLSEFSAFSGLSMVPLRLMSTSMPELLILVLEKMSFGDIFGLIRNVKISGLTECHSVIGLGLSVFV